MLRPVTHRRPGREVGIRRGSVLQLLGCAHDRTNHDAASVLPETVQLPLVRVVLGGRGLTKQRNHGAQAAPAETRYVLFLDDDTELAPEYLERSEVLGSTRMGISQRRAARMVAAQRS